MTLGELAEAAGCTLHGEPSQPVRGITHVAQKVQPAFVFAALPGRHHHGLEFSQEALARGAVAICSDQQPKVPIAWLATPNPRRATALAAWALAAQPHKKLTMVGITGTNGKSTVADLVSRIFEAAGRKVGVFGTLAYRLPHRQLPAERTTPEPTELAPLLAELVAAGGDTAVMEVSSHALALDRVAGLELDVACWTNFTQDHLDFHQTMEAYFAAKHRIFALLRTSPRGSRVVNNDDPWLAPLTENLQATDLTFGFNPKAHVRAEELSLSLSGSRFALVTPQGKIPLSLPLLGRHNVANALAAAACALAAGIDLEAIASGLGDAEPLLGRLERIPLAAPFTAFVDYAHTPDALRQVLSTVRTLTSGRLIVVFGCGGDRDPGKRPLMGQVVAELADVPIVTSDNPRSEDPGAIIAQILEGMVANPRTLVLPDRRDAIAAALKLAEPGSVVVIAGKGHEQMQIFAQKSVPFSDKAVALELWQGRQR